MPKAKTPKATDVKRRFIIQVEVSISHDDLEDLDRDEVESLWSNIEDGLMSVDFEQHGRQVIRDYYAAEVADITVRDVRETPKPGAHLFIGRNRLIGVR